MIFNKGVYTLPEMIMEVENHLFGAEKGQPSGHFPLPRLFQRV